MIPVRIDSHGNPGIGVSGGVVWLDIDTVLSVVMFSELTVVTRV